MNMSTRTYVVRSVLLAAAYVSASYLSFFLIPAGGSGVSLVWPPAALALGALFLFGESLWPALLVPFFVLLLLRGLSPPLAALFALANVLEAVLGAYLLRRFNFHAMFNRLQDSLVLTLTAFISTLVSATIIAGALHYFGNAQSISQVWMGIWIGHTVSLISFAPFMLRWIYKPHFTRSSRQWIEGVILVAGFTAISVLTYWTPYGTIDSISLLYVSIIFLIWAALRMGPRGMTLLLFLMALIASTGLLFGFGPLTHNPNLAQSLLSIQLVVGILSLIFLLFSTIVEERKEAAVALQINIDQLSQALEQIRSEDQAKADFIAILAHELRNPLSPILSSLELMKANGLRKENEAHVSSIASHVHVLARLLDDLLDLSRISQRKFKLQRDQIELGTIIKQSLEMALPALEERGHTLTIEEPQEPLWLYGDPVRLGQVVTNLLINAAKYTDRGGRVRLTARRVGQDAVLEVSDTGVGIVPERLSKIFEAFGANDPGAQRGGLHIGLSLVKRMVSLHQGSVEAKSGGPNQGSTFTVKLPLMPQAPLALEGGAPPRSRFSPQEFGKSKSTLGALSILVVDDNEAAADSIAKLLEHGGHKTHVAYDAPQALEIADKEPLHAALLDIGLPTMDGYELARRMRQKFGDDISLIALTGYGQADDKEKAHDAGFDKHLIKPVSIVDVERVLMELGK